MRYGHWATSAALALTLAAFATGQPPRGKGPSVKELEDEVAALKAKLEAAEKKLKAAREGEKKGKGRPDRFGRGFGKMDQEKMKEMMERFQKMAREKGFGKFDAEKMKEMMERFQKMRPERGKKEEKKESKRPEKGRGDRAPADKIGDIEKRLDQLSRELEELRKALKRR